MFRRNKFCDRPRLSESERKVADSESCAQLSVVKFCHVMSIFNFARTFYFCDEGVSTERFRFTFIYMYRTLYILLVKYTAGYEYQNRWCNDVTWKHHHLHLIIFPSLFLYKMSSSFVDVVALSVWRVIRKLFQIGRKWAGMKLAHGRFGTLSLSAIWVNNMKDFLPPKKE